MVGVAGEVVNEKTVQIKIITTKKDILVQLLDAPKKSYLGERINGADWGSLAFGLSIESFVLGEN